MPDPAAAFTQRRPPPKIGAAGETVLATTVNRLLVALALLGSAGCAAHTSLGPVGTGHLVPTAGFGGPIVKAFGIYMPLPYTTAGADYGLTPNLNFTGDLHILPLAYRVVGLDAGVSWFPLHGSGRKAEIGIQARVFGFVSLKSDVSSPALFYPVTTLSVAWPGVYAGTDLAGPLPQPDYDNVARTFVISPFVGRRWKVFGVFLLTELKWQGANLRTDRLAVEYVPLANYGGLTPLIAIQRRF